jgi:DNA-binding transcriptional LysR family regulator
MASCTPAWPRASIGFVYADSGKAAHATYLEVTPAGEILQMKVEGMMREFDRVKSHVAALQDLQVGTVDVYGFQAAAGGIVAPVMNELHRRT